MRILCVSTSYPLHLASSSGIFVKRLVDALRTDNQVDVLCPDDNRTGSHDGVDRFCYAPKARQTLAHLPGGIPAAIARSGWNRLWVMPFLFSMLFGVLKRIRRYDVVLANWAVVGCIAGLVGRLTGVPVVTVVRGFDAQSTGEKLPLMLRLALWLSHGTVVVSEELAASIHRLAPKSKLRFIPNGVMLGDDRASVDRRHGQPFRLIFVGSLIPRKGVDVLIRAFGVLRNREVNASLSIVGDGELRPELVALSRSLDIQSHVRFIGEVPPERVATILSEHDVFVLPSYAEGRPNVLLEAMAANCACVASDISGVRELSGLSDERAWRFPVGSVDGLAAVLEDVFIKPHVAARKVKLAKEYLESEGLTWGQSAKKYQSFMWECIK